MPNPTTTELTMGLISFLYVLLFRFQRWLAGDLTGLCPTGRSSPVVGGNTPIEFLVCCARLRISIPLILLSYEFASIPSPPLRGRRGSSRSQKDKKIILDSLIKPTITIPLEATNIHGITNEMVEKAPEIQ
jgi:DNA polymerase III epsilon subunit-like protein